MSANICETIEKDGKYIIYLAVNETELNTNLNL